MKSQSRKYRFNHVVAGGTFDLFHKGHETLLLTAFKRGRFVSIGVTSDPMNKKLHKNPSQKQTQRVQNLKDFLKKHHLEKRAKIVPINNLYGTTLSDKSIDGLVVSQYTLKGAHQVNLQRAMSGLPKLPVVICPKILADDGKPLSSSRIRAGDIDRNGRSFKKILMTIAGEKFAKKVRTKLKKPFGPIVRPPKREVNKPLITVGDITTAKFLKIGVTPKISIVDLSVGRKRLYNDLTDLGFNFPNSDFQVVNVPGQISKKLISTIEKSLKSPSNQVILVKGEEDLATIPTILLSPLGTTVCYGQPKKGIVKVKVDKEIKEKLVRLIT